MAFESFTSGHESPMTAEVKRLLPRITDEIELAAARNSFLSAKTKGMITTAISITSREAMNELLDHSRHYRDLPDTESQLRRVLNDRISRELTDELSSKANEKEMNALLLFLRYDVLNLRPR